MLKLATILVFTIVSTASSAQTNTPLGTAFAICSQVAKAPSGQWALKGPLTLDIGNCKNTTLQTMIITPRGMVMCGVDLYQLFEDVCGKR